MTDLRLELAVISAGLAALLMIAVLACTTDDISLLAWASAFFWFTLLTPLMADLSDPDS